MSNEAYRPGLSALLALGAAAMLGLGAVLLGASGASFSGIFGAWFTIVAASLLMLSCGLAWTIDRLVGHLALRRGALTVGATVIVTTLGAWSVWFGMGSPSQGTLTEAVPILVDPIVAALLGLAAPRRPERLAALAFVGATVLTIGVVVQRVATVGPSYAL